MCFNIKMHTRYAAPYSRGIYYSINSIHIPYLIPSEQIQFIKFIIFILLFYFPIFVNKYKGTSHVRIINPYLVRADYFISKTRLKSKGLQRKLNFKWPKAFPALIFNERHSTPSFKTTEYVITL